jgi:glycosyltransferase involved in cell wall biosynthesis
MAKISVIIPAYNPQNVLFEALESAFNQTYKNVEVILVNDGSEESCANIFAEAKQKFPELILINLPVNKGVASARNLGAKTATGEYLAFLDQDDFWSLNKLEVQFEYLKNNKNVDYVTSRQRYFLADPQKPVPSWVKESQMNTSLAGFLPGTLFVRANVFEKSGGFDESLKAGTDDVDWFFRANSNGLTTYEIPEDLLHKRIHNQNLSSAALSHNKELLSVVRMNLLRKKQISVIIPCYNAKKYILEALNSIANTAAEVIVVDDASTDGSADYVESLNYPNVKLFRLSQNGGISIARNFGVKQAQHSIIAFLDADDLWTEKRNEKLLAAMKDTPWVFGKIEHFMSDDCPEDLNYSLPPVQIGYFASAMLVTKEFFNKVGGFNEALRVGEFIDWFDRARAFNQPPAIVDYVVLQRRIHGKNTSIMSANKNASDYLKVARAAIARKKSAL